ncbi:MAG: fused MFS/spermidine synthase [Undibacterium umbellatum]|uniref:fused MFS/spermidine synthase n=1 Tax=Undibacterium umbellatum TaxID=2762300 RepID=UPI003BB66E00
MKKPRQSLSSLFLNKVPAAEREHIRHLEEIQKVHEGRPFHFDDGNLRIMYLNPKCMQSAMKLDAPDELVCAYSRTVMGLLMFHPQPRHILLIGLGGGSLVKYCYRHLPDSRITVLEINADVIAMRDLFMLPQDDERLKVIHCDAVTHLQINTYDADVLLLDAYDENGLVADLNTAEFYAICHSNLQADGIMVANVWGKPSALAGMLSRLRQQFARQVNWARSPDSYNLIVYAIKGVLNQADENAVKALSDQNPGLQFSELKEHLLSLPLSAEYSSTEKELLALKQSLATIMVPDANVPQNYADWKKQVGE